MIWILFWLRTDYDSVVLSSRPDRVTGATDHFGSKFETWNSGHPHAVFLRKGTQRHPFWAALMGKKDFAILEISLNARPALCARSPKDIVECPVPKTPFGADGHAPKESLSNSVALPRSQIFVPLESIENLRQKLFDIKQGHAKRNVNLQAWMKTEIHGF